MSKFRFNKELLDIVEDKLGIGGWLIRGLKYFVVSVLLAVFYYIIYAMFFNFKEEELLAKHNKMTEQELAIVDKRMNNLESVIEDLKKRDIEIYKGIFKASPPSLTAGGYSKNLFEQIDSSRDESIIKFTSLKVKITDSLSIIENKKIGAIKQYLKNLSSDVLRTIPSILPVEYIGTSQTGASVGKKIHPFYKTATFHNGLDLLSPIGTDVIATADGVVTQVTKAEKGKGNTVAINHGNEYKTVYSHLNEILVRSGQIVKRGSVIAKVGNSGLSFAPHLHYEVIFKGSYMEPINYFFAELSPSQLREMLVVAINSGQSLD